MTPDILLFVSRPKAVSEKLDVLHRRHLRSILKSRENLMENAWSCAERSR